MLSAMDAFRSMLKNPVGPGLQAMGFVGAGKEWRLPDADRLALLGIQRWSRSTPASVKFTVNLMCVRRNDWTAFRGDKVYLPIWPRPNDGYSDPSGTIWQARVGHLMPVRKDWWWDITPNGDTRATGESVLGAIRRYGLPALRERLGSTAERT